MVFDHLRYRLSIPHVTLQCLVYVTTVCVYTLSFITLLTLKIIHETAFFLLFRSVLSSKNFYATATAAKEEGGGGRGVEEEGAPAGHPQKGSRPPLPESKSFAMNLFRGQLCTDQVFPYPEALSEDQKENLSLLIDPTQKFFNVSSFLKYNLWQKLGGITQMVKSPLTVLVF